MMRFATLKTRRYWAGILTAGTLLAACESGTEDNQQGQHTMPDTIAPPIAAIRPYAVRSPFGDRTDDYYWLRDDTRSDPDVLAYLNAENAYKEAQLAHLEPVEELLFSEINNRIKKDDSSVPHRYRGYFYYVRYEGDDEYPIYARKKESLDNAEEIFLDVNELSKGHDYYDIGDYEISPDGKQIAYAEDTVGRRQYTIRFKNLATGEMLDETVSGVSDALVWGNDNRTLFYIETDPTTLLTVRVKRHEIGTNPEEDVTVYEEADDSFYIELDRSGDDRYLTIELDSTTSTEILFLDADDPGGEFAVLNPRERDHEYDADHIDQRWIIRTNWQAENFRIMQANDDGVHDRNNWDELIPHRPDTLIEEFDVFDRYLTLSERTNALLLIRIVDRKSNQSFVVKSDDRVYVTSLDVNPEQDSEWLRYSYSSLTTPDTLYTLNMRTRERLLLKQETVLGGFDPAHYVTERVWAPARDGARIPVSLVYRRGFKKNGTAPLYQYGYGAYGYSNDPEFDEDVLSLLDRGFIYAIAHVRGGQEMGRDWYESGRLLNKKNTFYDFIDVTEHLVAERFAHADRIIAAGGSAGGLLIGTVANLRPELYRVMVSDVAFVDAVTTMLDETIPLTTNEFDEWGNPKLAPYYKYILSYSPYDNVARQDYPDFWVTAGLWDSQVQYFEPAKWVARLRALKTDTNLLLFHINMDSGHGGQSGRFRENRELAMQYAFILDRLGITEEPIR